MDADDLGPGETEAEAQREETVLPWIWGGVGILGVAAFILLLTLWPARKPPHPHPQGPVTTAPTAP